MGRFQQYLENVQEKYPTLKVVKLQNLKDYEEGWEILSGGETQFYIYRKGGKYKVLDDGGNKVSKKQEEKLFGHPLIIDKLGL